MFVSPKKQKAVAKKQQPNGQKHQLVATFVKHYQPLIIMPTLLQQKPMEESKLIWSNKPGWWLLRHASFWFLWSIYFGFLHALLPFAGPEHSAFNNLGYTVPEATLYLATQALLVYPLIYFVLPRFVFKNRYGWAIFWCLVFMAVATVVNHWMVTRVNEPLLDALLPKSVGRITRKQEMKGLMGMLANAKGGLAGVGLAVSLKLIKYWHQKEKRNVALMKEKTEAQIRLLTAQIHPHFLFNTLNNIYAETQHKAPQGSRMILELSEILRYLLGEGQKHEVPLYKELNLLRNYINLEKIRYGNNLELHLSMPKETGHLQIAPLILLPFVENCFKHGASKFLQAPWVNLEVTLDGRQLVFKLMNGKSEATQDAVARSGIGIANVKKRLELLYPNAYELKIEDQDNVYIVMLRMQLREHANTPQNHNDNLTPIPAYAEQ